MKLYLTRHGETIDKHAKDAVLLVCHGGIGKALIAALFNTNETAFADMENLDNTNLSTFEVDGQGNYQVICYNSTDHLN